MNWKNKSAHQIDWNCIILSFKYGVLTTFFTITFQILILDYRYCYFLILQKLGCWKMYRNTFQDVLEAEKGAKQKWVLFFETPCSLKIWDVWSGPFRAEGWRAKRGYNFVKSSLLTSEWVIWTFATSY